MIPPPLAGICSEPVRATTVRPTVTVTETWHARPLSQMAGRPPVPPPPTYAVLPATPMWGLAVAIAEVPSTLPRESSACTSKSATPVGAAIAVSNPLRLAFWSGIIELGPVPASTRHDDTAVAPFQLAQSSVVPSLFGASVIGGGPAGWPLQLSLYAR